jgi:hypothetical protein
MSNINTTVNIFEQASRLRPVLRFETNRGQITTEDLWDLPLTSAKNPNLDDIARTLNKKLKETGDTVSFVENTAKADERTQVAFDVVLHVIGVKKDEAAARATETAKADEKRKLLELLAEKQEGKLKDLSEDEIKARIAALS